MRICIRSDSSNGKAEKKMSFPRSVVTVLTFLLGCSLPAIGETVRLDPNNLLQYHNGNGQVRPVETPEHWQKRRLEILEGVQVVMGKLPDDERRVALQIEVKESVDLGSYVRRLVTYQSDPDSRTPAYLCVPKQALSGERRAQAVLCLHPTDMKVGHKVVVGLGGKSGRGYASELAERGYVTLSPAYPHMANYWPNLGELRYVSGSMKAIWDNSRGLDLLASLPYVDDSRGFAAIGHSLGGHNAIYTAVFDQRITVLASSCGFDSYPDYKGGKKDNWYFGKGWSQIRYMPRMANYRGEFEKIPFDFQELIGALAPRPFFVNAPLGDGNFQWKSVDACAAAAGPIYKLLGGETNLIVKHPDCGHDFPQEMREAAYKVIGSVLRP